MVKNLADELSDILDWVENPGLGEHAREEANAGLVIFCRGLVCGLRGGLQVTGDTPISVDEVPCAKEPFPSDRVVSGLGSEPLRRRC